MGLLDTRLWDTKKKKWVSDPTSYTEAAKYKKWQPSLVAVLGKKEGKEYTFTEPFFTKKK